MCVVCSERWWVCRVWDIWKQKPTCECEKLKNKNGLARRVHKWIQISVSYRSMNPCSIIAEASTRIRKQCARTDAGTHTHTHSLLIDFNKVNLSKCHRNASPYIAHILYDMYTFELVMVPVATIAAKSFSYYTCKAYTLTHTFLVQRTLWQIRLTVCIFTYIFHIFPFAHCSINSLNVHIISAAAALTAAVAAVVTAHTFHDSVNTLNTRPGPWIAFALY